jgi:hypothetical protein
LQHPDWSTRRQSTLIGQVKGLKNVIRVEVLISVIGRVVEHLIEEILNRAGHVHGRKSSIGRECLQRLKFRGCGWYGRVLDLCEQP